MPGIQLTRQNDELQKKLADLIEKANAARRALALVGASPQQQRNSEILEKYNEFLAQQKDQLDKLTPAQRAHDEMMAHDAIATQVNAEAATKYAVDLLNLHEALATSTQDHIAMASAIGKSAQAMQDATVQVKLNEEMQKTFGANWRANPAAMSAASSLGDSITEDLNRDNSLSDRKVVDSLQRQLDAQLRLNAAILQGAEAKRQAQISNDQAAVRQDFASRGDTDLEAMQRQVEAVRQKSDAEKQASDLERAASMSVATQYQDRLRAIQDAITAAKAYGVAIDYREVLAADKEAWIAFQDAQDKAILATGGMLDGMRVALDQLARDTESDAQMMHDAFMHAIDSINQSLSQTLMAHAYNGAEYRRNIVNGLSNTSRGIGTSLMNTAMKKGESTLLKGAGFGKPDGSSQNPWFVKIVGTANRNNPVGGSYDPLRLNAPNVDTSGWASSQSSSTTNTLFKTLFGAVIQGAFADGGSVVPGMPAIIGERGPELWMPPSAGTVLPNSALRSANGDIHHWHIDATGAHDPAHTVALIHAYMQKAGPQIAGSAVKAVHEGALRKPSMAR